VRDVPVPGNGTPRACGVCVRPDCGRSTASRKRRSTSNLAVAMRRARPCCMHGGEYRDSPRGRTPGSTVPVHWRVDDSGCRTRSANV
jgi:hypothetical protein